MSAKVPTACIAWQLRAASSANDQTWTRATAPAAVDDPTAGGNIARQMTFASDLLASFDAKPAWVKRRCRRWPQIDTVITFQLKWPGH